ncbi:hypothetical protein AF6_0156 [Anoxybacillus flavithermus TNO-09.006]|uniref:Uncharacterized protein n=1 Tax=Anoxybacillus flavithermus TaxID=33934 RepID=A0A178TQQ5_9BACL|nr:hypothetical protein AF6_0156 [Anoxybacillus flavithermus TNO-09.006]OAO83152.1 hypothetical protein TAF16_0080 [Anoxybacillus flavithermus]
MFIYDFIFHGQLDSPTGFQFPTFLFGTQLFCPVPDFFVIQQP